MLTGVICECGNQWNEEYGQDDLKYGYLVVDCDHCGARGVVKTGLLVDILLPFKRWFD